MQAWTWALLLKPFIGMAWFVAVFGGAWLIARVLKSVFPNGPVKEYLFRGWDDRRPQPSTRPRERGLDDASVVGRKALENDARPSWIGKHFG